MKTYRIGFASTLLGLVLLFSACASNKINWDTRVGNYTYDQAITELGPPDKMAMLSDNIKVAEWHTHPSSGISVGAGTGTGHVGMGVGMPVGNPVRSLRLTFGADGTLKSWSK